VLLDPLEEEFHLPARFVEFANDLRGQVHMIAQEDQGSLSFHVVETNAPQGVRVILPGVEAAEDSDVIAAKALLAVDGLRTVADEVQVVLGANDKVGLRPVQAMEAREIHVPTVHDVEGAESRM